jgi:hypothetical protein
MHECKWIRKQIGHAEAARRRSAAPHLDVADIDHNLEKKKKSLGVWKKMHDNGSARICSDEWSGDLPRRVMMAATSCASSAVVKRSKRDGEMGRSSEPDEKKNGGGEYAEERKSKGGWLLAANEAYKKKNGGDARCGSGRGRRD